MLTFRQFLYEQFLILEERLNKIKDIFKNKIDTSHDTLAQHKDSDAIVDHFATHADPTQNKAHTQWIVSRYRQGQFRQEDHPRIREALSTFDRPAVKAGLKANKKPTDINQYKSLSDLEDAVEPHKEAISGKEEEKKIKTQGADLIHSDNGVTVHHIKTKDAACSYGAGTKWCTAGEKNNMFDYYNKKGPIHVIQHQGRKYQFHTESNQFMDEKDKPVKFTDLHPDIAKSLSKSTHPEIEKLNITHGNPNATPENITKALDHKDRFVRQKAIEHPNATVEHITKALNDEDPDVRKKAIQHLKATPEHITKALDDKDQWVRIFAIIHPKATPEHITKALDHKDRFVRQKAIEHPNATVEHITKALDDKYDLVRRFAIEHPKATSEHITKALNDENPDVRKTAIQHLKATTEHITKALNDENHHVRRAAKEVEDLNDLIKYY
jgi:t-SNARE complex subunit (syntaxin)